MISVQHPTNNISMQSFTVPNTDYHASPASTGIDPSKFDEYFSDGYQKQVLCAAYPHCTAPQPLDSNNSPHRCSGCGLNIHCELWCGTYYNLLEIHPPQLPEYGRSRIQSELKSETENMILKIEAMESEVESLDGNAKKLEVNTGEQKAAEAFVEKLKERVEQKEDLITRLKRQSVERDIDPKTGKFKTMTPSEYKDRVKSTDVDFMQFLKDTVANEQELQKDLEAFQGLLERKFGPVV